MTPEQALKTIDSAVAQLSTNRDSHVALQQAISILAEAIKPKE